MSYPSSDVTGVNLAAGAMATAGGKNVSCSNSGGSTMCVAFGVNNNVIGDGIVAIATFDVPSGAPDPSAAIQITGVVTSDASGNGISSSGSGGTITISHPVTPPTLSGVSCTQASVTAPGTAACMVTLSSPAPASGFGVTLTSSNSNVSVPSPLTVPSAASSANFTATVATVSSAQNATLTASAAGVSKTFLLNIVPPPPQTWSISGTISPNGGGATVSLSGASSASVSADASGNYTFSGLANGAYTVTPAKTGFTFTPANQTVTISSANQTAINFTAQAQPPQTWSISGTISPNGGGATVALSGAANASVTSDASGNYTFSGLADGTYTVTPSRSGFTYAPTSQSVTISGADVTGINFSDPLAITLVQHTSRDAGTTTSATLAFNSNNTAGNFIAVVIRAGYSSAQVFTVTDSNGNTYRQAVQFGQTAGLETLGIFYAENIKVGPNTVAVSDTVSGPLRFAILEYSGVATSNSLDATAAAQGFSASPSSGNATTTANGDLLLGAVLTNNFLSFTAGSNYTIEESIPAEPNTKLIAEDQIQTAAGTASASVSISQSDNWAAGLAAFKAASGTPPAPPATPPTITSLSPSSGAVGTAIAITGTNFGASGTVTFNNATATTTSWSPTSIAISVPNGATTGNVVVTTGGVASNGVVFTVTPAIQTWNISGTLSSSASGSGATVKLSGPATATVTADTSGNYSFSGLANGTYTVTPSKSGYTFSPASQAVTVNGASMTAINFTAQPQTWGISGTISPSATAGGATVTLSGAASASTTADASGNYTFNGLANGAYTVTPSKIGYTFTPAKQAVTVISANQTAINFTAAPNQTAAPISTDAVVWRDRSTASFNVSSPGFSTVSGNELLLAFIAADYQWGQNTTVTKVSGAGLTWVLAVRTRVQKGTSEIWRAFAPAPLSNVSVTASLSQKVTSSITVVSFTGVDTSGTNGSGAIGATGSANASSGTPLATLLTTRNNSFVIGVGNDPHEPILRTPAAGQGVVHQFLVSDGNTHWVQAQSTLTPLSGTSVSINDTAPTSDPYNLSILEILAAPSGGAVTTTTGTVTDALAKSGEGVQPRGSSPAKVALLTMANPANGQTGQVCSPGGLAALVGTGLTTQRPQRATSFPLPTRLAQLQVKVNGIPVPLLFASDSQINFQCPPLPAGSPLEITLEAEHAIAESIQSTMQPAAPGIFTLNGTNQGAVLIANTNKIAMPVNEHLPSRAAHPGEFLTIYASGLGAAGDGVAAGTPAPLDRPILLRNKIRVVVGGVDIEPAFAGLAPGTAGIFQVNVMVPDSVASGPEVPMNLRVILDDGTVVESNTVTAAIAGKSTER